MENSKVLISVLLIASFVTAIPPFKVLDQEFQAFKAAYGKNYTHETEEHYRFNVYLENKMKIAEHNQRYARGEVPYKLGVNAFSDKTEGELKQHLGLLIDYPILHTKEVNETNDDDDIPLNIDWRTKGAVTSVKDQGHCGSCWAFSAVGALEGQRFIKTGKLEDLSVQQLVDCSTRNYKCDGGLPALAYEFVERIGGLAAEKDYRPYDAKAHDCQSLSPGQGGIAHGYRSFKKGDRNALKKAVAKYGPISVGYSVDMSFYNYDGGFYDCGFDLGVNHAMLLVGYGFDESWGDYFIVKNSWGTDWGEDGYFRLLNRDGTCSISVLTSIPIAWEHE